MQNGFTNQQKRHLQNNGFAFLKRTQIEKLLKDQVVKNDDEINLEIFDYYDRMKQKQREDALWLTMEYIANNKSIEVKKYKLLFFCCLKFYKN